MKFYFSSILIIGLTFFSSFKKPFLESKMVVSKSTISAEQSWCYAWYNDYDYLCQATDISESKKKQVIAALENYQTSRQATDPNFTLQSLGRLMMVYDCATGCIVMIIDHSGNVLASGNFCDL
jgi:hypothetical protein